MDILIDIGNTRVKWKAVSVEAGSENHHFLYQSTTFINDLEKSITGNINDQISHVYVSNVAGEKIKIKLVQWFVDKFQVKPVFAQSQRKMHGLVSAYIHPEQLGVDRFLAMLGANVQPDEAMVIIDCGTAVTVDCVNTCKQFVGGVILPGINLMRNSLFHNAAALNVPVKEQNFTMFATDTDLAIGSGTILAVTSVIETAMKKLKELSGVEPKCIVTGGDGELIRSQLSFEADYCPDLVLEGLSVYFSGKADGYKA